MYKIIFNLTTIRINTMCHRFFFMKSTNVFPHNLDNNIGKLPTVKSKVENIYCWYIFYRKQLTILFTVSAV